jgi:hypothetical protein
LNNAIEYTHLISIGHAPGKAATSPTFSC